jgi:Family of unknown function (DUF6152)
MEKLARTLFWAALLAPAGALWAHHGNSAYDETARVPIKGTVIEFIWTNPHSQIYVDVKDGAGKVVHWGIETNSPGILTRAGWTRPLAQSRRRGHDHSLPRQERTTGGVHRVGRPWHQSYVRRRPRA